MKAMPKPRIGKCTWLKVLLGGVLLFIILERAFVATEDINYLPSLLLIGAFTAPAAFCALLYSRVKAPEVSLELLGLCALWGGVIGTVIAGSLEYDTLKRLNFLPTIAIGIIEELAKLLVPAYILFRKKYSHVVDGIIVGVATGAGFAALESMGYGLSALIQAGGNINSAIETLLFRGISSPAAHIAWTGLLSGALWQAARTNLKHRYRNLILTFLGVVLLHSAWDSVTSLWTLVLIGVISLVWLFRRIQTSGKT